MTVVEERFETEETNDEITSASSPPEITEFELLFSS